MEVEERRGNEEEGGGQVNVLKSGKKCAVFGVSNSIPPPYTLIIRLLQVSDLVWFNLHSLTF